MDSCVACCWPHTLAPSAVVGPVGAVVVAAVWRLRKAEAVVALAARSTAEHILVSALRRNTIASVRDTIRKLPNTIRKLPNTIRKLYACNHDEIRWSRNTIRKLLIRRHRTRPDIGLPCNCIYSTTSPTRSSASILSSGLRQAHIHFPHMSRSHFFYISIANSLIKGGEASDGRWRLGGGRGEGGRRRGVPIGQ